MTEYTRPATWDDLKRIAQYLNEAGVDYALVGGYALAAHGFNRFTEDIDILVDPGAENSRRWIVALGRLPDSAALELAAQADVFATDGRYAVRVNDEITVDVLPSVAGHTWEDMKPFVEQRDLDGVPIRVLSLEGLLKTKQGARPKDQADAQILRAAIEQLKRDRVR
jgi:ABC-type glycerol-3-phosphate transport system substrate-binding protein